MTPEQKALRACADYARLNAEIRRLTSELAESLSTCPGMHGSLLAPHHPYDAQTERKREADCTHLKAAYAPEVEGDGCSQWTVYMEADEIREYLAECPHCLAAHDAIQARKVARRRLGATKRFIGKLGRAAAKATS
jgi:hypothetical protein